MSIDVAAKHAAAEGDPSDEDMGDLAVRALLSLAQLGRPSTRADRSRISREEGIPHHVFGWLVKKGALRPVPEIGDGAKTRELTDRARAWLGAPDALRVIAASGAIGFAAMHEALAAFAREDGLGPMHRERSHVIASPQEWRQNLWEPLRKVEPFRGMKTGLHRWVHHLRSSQAFAFNLFGPLAAAARDPRFYWARVVWARWFPDVLAVKFEYPHSGDPLRETTEPDGPRTRVDVLVESVARRALVEVKLTETGFGACSAGQDRENPCRSFCQRPGWTAEAAQGACYLSKLKGRRYFELLPGSPANLEVLTARGASGCPLRGGLYQIVRNLLMAGTLDVSGPRLGLFVAAPAQRYNGALHSEAGRYGAADLADLLRRISRPDMIETGFISLEEVLTEARAIPEATEWLSYMERKYVAALKAGERSATA